MFLYQRKNFKFRVKVKRFIQARCLIGRCMKTSLGLGHTKTITASSSLLDEGPRKWRWFWDSNPGYALALIPSLSALYPGAFVVRGRQGRTDIKRVSMIPWASQASRVQNEAPGYKKSVFTSKWNVWQKPANLPVSTTCSMTCRSKTIYCYELPN